MVDERNRNGGDNRNGTLRQDGGGDRNGSLRQGVGSSLNCSGTRNGKSRTDRRVQYTKRALRDALVRLMRKSHISKVSVKALCDAADVNRSTFYAHYRNQYDLLAQIEAEVLADLQTYLLEDMPRTRNIVKMLEYAQANADLFIMLLEESEGEFQRQIMELAQLVDRRMNNRAGASDQEEYLYLFAVTGALGVLTQWLKKGTPQSPAEMSALLLKMIQSGIGEGA